MKKKKKAGYVLIQPWALRGTLLYFEPFLLVSLTITRPGLGREYRLTFSELCYAIEWSYVAKHVRATFARSGVVKKAR
jgi:hypothetical protein